MEMIVRILVDFVLILNYVVMCDRILLLPRKKYKHWLSKLLVLIVSGVIGWNIFNAHYDGSIFMGYLLFGCFFLLIIAVYMIFYEGEKKKLVFMGMWSVWLILMVAQILCVIVKIVCAIMAIPRNRYLQNFFAEVLTMVCFLIMGVFMRKRYKKGIKDFGIGYYIGYAVLALGNFVTVGYLGEFVIGEVHVRKRLLFAFIFMVVVIGILIQMAMVLFLILSKKVHKENEKLAAKYLNEQKNYYEYLEERDRKTKKIRHDLASHLYVMQTLCLNKEDDKLEEYMNVMNGEIQALGNVVSVNNGIVDAILNKYLDEAEKLGIHIEVTGHFPLECRVSAFDLCIIFSNLLSNALEAEKQCECGNIKVSCGYNEEQIAVYVENHVKGNVLKRDGKLQTTKQDKCNHGFGLENVEECVKQNGGEMLIDHEENRFKVIIFLDNRVE